ncbi:hypothetical protein HZB04_01255 [Candidatus Wolfebacteria bacterium]|nr:hypothetical protein [Candidatus Wolfebacteria bacterium]
METRYYSKKEYLEIKTVDGKKIFLVNIDKNSLLLFVSLDEKRFCNNEFSAEDAEGNRISIKGSEIILGA